MPNSTPTAGKPGALAGVRILDLSRLLPGPFATLLLADLGAEVLKVEDPIKGDYTRISPPFMGSESARFMSLNRGKRSMMLNLKKPGARDVLLRLVQHYDVLIEQFRPGVMDRLGVGYEVLKSANPRLIYCALTGYGQDGPYRDRAGHDLNYLSLAGITGTSGWASSPPAMYGVQVADIAGGGLMAVAGILAAVVHRARTNEGQFVDVSMLDGSLSLLAMHAGSFFADGHIPRREGEALNGHAICYRVYETKDGKAISLGALEPQFWIEFCKAVDRADLIPEAFADGDRREWAVVELSEVFRSRTRDEWVDFLKDVDCCVEPVLDFKEAFEHPQAVARDMVWTLDHPEIGPVRQVGCPIKLSATPPSVSRMPPKWGEHTREVMGEIGYRDAEVDALEAAGVFS
jgi:crotonobetainyl-CoA:carnitine CoA-transferase CaiB-like acyl-CoA transferase